MNIYMLQARNICLQNNESIAGANASVDMCQSYIKLLAIKYTGVHF